MSSTGLQKELTQEETVLQFEYTSSEDINNFQLFVGPTYSSSRCISFGPLAATNNFSGVELDLNEAISKYGFGKENSRIRFDFGSKAGVNIAIRNIRITHKGDNLEWKYDNAFPLLSDLLNQGLTVVDIWTENYQEPTCDVIAPPEGCMGSGITNAIKVPGSLKIYEKDGSVGYDSGDYVKSESGLTIKVRGNTSASLDPKPFKIKLQKKGDLLRRGDKKYNDKNWVLLQDPYMKLHNGFIVNNALKMSWTPQSEYVSVFINGFYRGIYLLAEGVERNTDCRLNVSKTGFIAELDPYWWNEDGQYLNSTYWKPALNYTLKYPEYDEADQEQLDIIQNSLNEFEKSIFDGTFDELIDCESFARGLLAQDIMGINDGYGSNVYISKYDDLQETKFIRPVLWDFDSAEECTEWSKPHDCYYHPILLNSENKSFKEEYVKLWRAEGESIIEDILDNLRSLKDSDLISAFNYAIKLTNKQFGHNVESGDSSLDIGHKTKRLKLGVAVFDGMV